MKSDREGHRLWKRARAIAKRVWKIVGGLALIVGLLVGLKALVGWPDDDGVAPLPDVRIDLAASLLDLEGGDPSSEFVCLVNADDGSVQLAGWELRDFKDQSVGLGEFLLKPQAGVRVHTGSRITPVANDLFGGKGSPIWDDDGDTVELLDAEERPIDKTKYGQRPEDFVPERCGK